MFYAPLPFFQAIEFDDAVAAPRERESPLIKPQPEGLRRDVTFAFSFFDNQKSRTQWIPVIVELDCQECPSLHTHTDTPPLAFPPPRIFHRLYWPHCKGDELPLPWLYDMLWQWQLLPQLHPLNDDAPAPSLHGRVARKIVRNLVSRVWQVVWRIQFANFPAPRQANQRNQPPPKNPPDKAQAPPPTFHQSPKSTLWSYPGKWKRTTTTRTLKERLENRSRC